MIFLIVWYKRWHNDSRIQMFQNKDKIVSYDLNYQVDTKDYNCNYQLYAHWIVFWVLGVCLEWGACEVHQ